MYIVTMRSSGLLFSILLATTTITWFSQAKEIPTLRIDSNSSSSSSSNIILLKNTNNTTGDDNGEIPTVNEVLQNSIVTKTGDFNRTHDNDNSSAPVDETSVSPRSTLVIINKSNNNNHPDDEMNARIKEELEFSSSTKYSRLKYGMKVSELHQSQRFSEQNHKPEFHVENSELTFFQRIQGLNLDWEDIIGSYRNVSAEVETALCKSRCKTTVALWVLQNLSPCDSIERRDCPKGLLCCSSNSELRRPYHHHHNDQPHKKELVKAGYENIRDYDDDGDLTPAPGIFVPFTLYNDDGSEQDIYYPEPILDPIPNDESSEILKV